MGEELGNGGRKGDIVGILIGVFNGGILIFYLRKCVYLSEGEGACILYIGGARYFNFFLYLLLC